MNVVDGPACADNLVWWKVHSDELYVTGWVVEREDETRAFPLPAGPGLP